jgi:hypothetical protein
MALLRKKVAIVLERLSILQLTGSDGAFNLTTRNQLLLIRSTSRGLWRLGFRFLTPPNDRNTKVLEHYRWCHALQCDTIFSSRVYPGEAADVLLRHSWRCERPFWAIYRQGLVNASKLYNVQIKDLGTQVTSVQAEVDLSMTLRSLRLHTC